MQDSLSHRPVLLKEAVNALAIKADGVYLDGTFGRGGHATAILSALGPAGRLLAIDRDPDAARCARQYFAADDRFHFEQASFSQLADVVARWSLTGNVQGVLLDIGVSSPQLDDPQRGFSFSKDGPLDMRMNPETGLSAADWLMVASEKELSRVFKDLGEERFHLRIARAIVKARQIAPIVSTVQLAKLIAANVPHQKRDKHPATRSFQAIRIFINRELEELEAALSQALQVLAEKGRLVVISFHSLEDRVVKRFMRRQARGLDWPPGLPVPATRAGATLRLIGNILRPGSEETSDNPRARSAVMRVAERLP